MLDFAVSALLAAAPSPTVQFWQAFGLFLLGTVPPYFLGVWLCRMIRMPEYGPKVGFILLAVGLATVILCAGTPKFGIDLKGGVILVYEVDRDDTAAAQQDAGNSGTDVNMDEVVQALSERLNPGGVNEIQVRRYGDRQVEIVVPDVGPEEVASIKRQVENAGRLELLLIANSEARDEAIALVRDNPVQQKERYVRNAEGKVVGKWVRVAWDNNPKTKRKELSVHYPNTYYRDAVTGKLLDESSRRIRDQGDFLAYLKSEGIENVDMLVTVDPDPKNWVEGTDMASAVVSTNRVGSYIVEFTMKPQGGVKLGNLTSANVSDPAGDQRYLGIVLDGNLRSAPSINSTIYDRGEITGRFTKTEVTELVRYLQSGKLPAVLQRDPISENQINPLLGMDTIRKGIISIAVSMIAVLVFMVIYYRFSGAVACLALVMNTILTVALMILISAAFTLPGLAGMVLSVGMSVDANVLIFERMREELAKGSALRMAIRNGFSRAMSTIIDSNLTTIITAVVLYVIGTEQLKGFAVTLILGICMSMFTAIFVSRVCFDIAERKRFLTKLTMMDWWGKSNIDFVRLYIPMTIASVVLIVIGIGAMIHRGRGMFDTDLNGGTSVEMLLTKPIPVAEVRAKLAAKFNPDKTDFTLTEISVAGREANTIYKVDTSLAEVTELEEQLEDVFKDEKGQSLLARNGVTVAAIAATEPFGPAATIKPALPAEKLPGDNKLPAEQPPADVSSGDKKSAPPATETPPLEESKKEDADKKDAGVTDGDQKEAAKDDADKSPDSPKPADGPPADSPPPLDPKTSDEKKDGEQLSIHARGAAPDWLLVAYQDEAAQPADATQDNKKKDDETTTPPAVAAPQPNDAAKPDEAVKPDDAKKEDKPINTPGAPATEETPAAPQTPAVAAAEPTAFSEGKVTFEYPLGAPTIQLILSDVVKKLADEGKLERKFWDVDSAEPTWCDLVPEPRSPEWTRDSSAKFPNWKVKIASTVADATLILDAVKAHSEETTVWTSSSKIGGKVAGNTRLQAIWAVLASLIGIIGYVWFRFHHLSYGVAAVVALVHDVLVTVGIIALSAYVAPFLGFLLIEEFKISLTVVAAILTLIGYSLNDTIVTFDRIREVKGKSPELTPEMINRSINETLSRTFLTAGTTLIVVVILYAMGGAGIHGFAFSMLVGVIAGTYSSIYIAAPLLLVKFFDKTPEPKREKSRVA